MPDKPLQIALTSPDMTAALAARIAQVLRPGDVLLLSGGIGAGKTHFARAVIQSLQDRPEDVPSPTFTIVQVYETGAGEIWHSDLYRLQHPDEAFELGLEEAFDTAICLVEWPDRLGDVAPRNALSLAFSAGHDDQRRDLAISWSGGDWAKRLKEAGLVEA